MNFKDLQSGTTVMKLSNYLEETVSFNNKDARLGKNMSRQVYVRNKTET